MRQMHSLFRFISLGIKCKQYLWIDQHYNAFICIGRAQSILIIYWNIISILPKAFARINLNPNDGNNTISSAL